MLRGAALETAALYLQRSVSQYTALTSGSLKSRVHIHLAVNATYHCKSAGGASNSLKVVVTSLQVLWKQGEEGPALDMYPAQQQQQQQLAQPIVATPNPVADTDGGAPQVLPVAGGIASGPPSSSVLDGAAVSSLISAAAATAQEVRPPVAVTAASEAVTAAPLVMPAAGEAAPGSPPAVKAAVDSAGPSPAAAVEAGAGAPPTDGLPTGAVACSARETAAASQVPQPASKDPTARALPVLSLPEERQVPSLSPVVQTEALQQTTPPQPPSVRVPE